MTVWTEVTIRYWHEMSHNTNLGWPNWSCHCCSESYLTCRPDWCCVSSVKANHLTMSVSTSAHGAGIALDLWRIRTSWAPSKETQVADVNERWRSHINHRVCVWVRWNHSAGQEQFGSFPDWLMYSLMSACISWWEKVGFFWVFLNTHAQMWSDEFDVCNLRCIVAVRDPSLMLLKWRQETKSTLPVLCKMQAKCLAEESMRFQQCNLSKSSLQCYSL